MRKDNNVLLYVWLIEVTTWTSFSCYLRLSKCWFQVWVQSPWQLHVWWGNSPHQRISGHNHNHSGRLYTAPDTGEWLRYPLTSHPGAPGQSRWRLSSEHSPVLVWSHLQWNKRANLCTMQINWNIFTYIIDNNYLYNLHTSQPVHWPICR